MAGKHRIGPFIIVGLVLLALAGAAFVALRNPAVPVDLGMVARRPMQVTIDDEAEARAHDLYVVSAPINGRLLRVDLEPGDRLIAGKTVVARLMPANPDFLTARTGGEARARVRSLEAMAAATAARIPQAIAERDLARRNLARDEALLKRGFLPQADHDRARMARDHADALVLEVRRAADAARYDLAAARAALTDPATIDPGKGGVFTLLSPVSGRVLRIPQKSEAVVAAGTPLVEIGDPSKLELVTDLLSADAVRIKPGFAATLEQWGGNHPIHARVRLVEPYGFTKISALGVEEQRVNVVLDFTEPLDRLQTIGDGFRVEAHIVVWRAADAVKVPVGALFRDGPGWAVFVIEDGYARKRAIKTARRNPVEALVEDGLKPDEAVVIYPPDALKDGAKVAVTKAPGR